MNRKNGRKLTLLLAFAAVLLVAVLALLVDKRINSDPRHEHGDIRAAAQVSVPDASDAPESGNETDAPEINYTLRFSEVMSSNKASLAAPDGSFPDWVELHNDGDAAVPAGGCRLCIGGDSFSLPDESIAAGGYLLIYCGGEPAEGIVTADMSISKDGAELLLKSPSGEEIDTLSVPALSSDTSYMLCEDGFTVSEYPTPGYENSVSGYNAFQESRLSESPLVINEVMVWNNSFQNTSDGKYYDIVELKNVSDEPVNLSDYYLSDSGKDRAMYRLPEKELKPGKLFVLHCGTDDNAPADVAPIGLNAHEDTLYLSASDGSLADYVLLRNIPLGGSCGRSPVVNGFGYFKKPTPGGENGGNSYRMQASRPIALQSDGVFNGVTSETVEITGTGEIHYTLDGTTPTLSSPLYTGPFEVSSTCVFRAVSFIDNCLPSDSLDLSYIINENHTMPVVSLICEPDEFTEMYKTPKVEYEKQGSFTLFEEDGGRAEIECGIKLHGATSKRAQKKKSMKLCFRSRYEDVLEYDIFGNGVTEFSSILLRAAQEDVYSTLMHDTLMHRLAIEEFPELSTQDSRYSVLYVNGQYWGIYDIREAHSTAHFANHNGLKEDSIVQWKERWDPDCPIAEVCSFAMNNDLSVQENYDYVAQYLDIDSIIDWCIMQTYSGNFDIHSPNMRFYYNKETGLMSYALVDLDLGLFKLDRGFEGAFDFGYAYNKLNKCLLQNEGFRLRFMEKLGHALSGTFSDDNVNAMITEMADYLRPEITRDRARWGGSMYNWEKMVRSMHEYIDNSGGRASFVVTKLNNYIRVTDEYRQAYFSDVK